MQFVIHCLDDPATPNARHEHYSEHLSRPRTPNLPLVLAGALLEEGTDRRIGSMLIVEAETAEQATSYIQSDAFYRRKVWKIINVHPLLVLVDNRGSASSPS